jgi:hypothetical protein
MTHARLNLGPNYPNAPHHGLTYQSAIKFPSLSPILHLITVRSSIHLSLRHDHLPYGYYLRTERNQTRLNPFRRLFELMRVDFDSAGSYRCDVSGEDHDENSRYTRLYSV